MIAFSVMLAIQPLRARLDTDRDPNTKFRGAVFKDLGVVWRNRGLRLLSMAALTLSGVQLALMTFAVTMLVEDVHLDLVTAGTGLAVLQVAGVVGRLAWGIVADKVGNGIMTLIVSQLLSAAAAWATAALVPDTPILTVVRDLGRLWVFGGRLERRVHGGDRTFGAGRPGRQRHGWGFGADVLGRYHRANSVHRSARVDRHLHRHLCCIVGGDHPWIGAYVYDCAQWQSAEQILIDVHTFPMLFSSARLHSSQE